MKALAYQPRMRSRVGHTLFSPMRFPGSHDDWLGLNHIDDDKDGQDVDREVDNGRHGGSSWWGNIGSKDSLEDIAAAVSAVPRWWDWPRWGFWDFRPNGGGGVVSEEVARVSGREGEITWERVDHLTEIRVDHLAWPGLTTWPESGQYIKRPIQERLEHLWPLRFEID